MLQTVGLLRAGHREKHSPAEPASTKYSGIRSEVPSSPAVFQSLGWGEEGEGEGGGSQKVSICLDSLFAGSAGEKSAGELRRQGQAGQNEQSCGGGKGLEHLGTTGSLSFLGTQEQNQSEWEPARRPRRLGDPCWRVVEFLGGNGSRRRSLNKKSLCRLHLECPPPPRLMC